MDHSRDFGALLPNHLATPCPIGKTSARAESRRIKYLAKEFHKSVLLQSSLVVVPTAVIYLVSGQLNLLLSPTIRSCRSAPERGSFVFLQSGASRLRRSSTIHLRLQFTGTEGLPSLDDGIRIFLHLRARFRLLWLPDYESSSVTTIISMTIANDFNVYPLDPKRPAEALDLRDLETFQKLLMDYFGSAVTSDYQWLHELDDSGYSKIEIAELALEDFSDSAWINFTPQVHTRQSVRKEYHVPGCAHMIPFNAEPQSLQNSEHLSVSISLSTY
jgi:hypothetical protein